MSGCKGQLYSTDLAVALFIFLVIMVSFLVLWQSSISRLSYFEAERWRDEGTRMAAAQLVETPGYPFHWNQVPALSDATLRSVGLARERNVINAEKMQRFLAEEAANYDFLKKALGLAEYEMRVVFQETNGAVIDTFGPAIPDDKHISSVSRVALLNNRKIVVIVYAWE